MLADFVSSPKAAVVLAVPVIIGAVIVGQYQPKPDPSQRCAPARRG